jgi:hypothetical protein
MNGLVLFPNPRSTATQIVLQPIQAAQAAAGPRREDRALVRDLMGLKAAPAPAAKR